MSQRFLGLILIALAAFIFVQLNQEPPGKNHKKKPTVLHRVLSMLQKQPAPEVDPLAEIPLCQELSKEFLENATMATYQNQIQEVRVLSQLKNTDFMPILEACLGQVFKPNSKLDQGFRIEVDVFDTSESNHNGNTRAWKSERSLDKTLSTNVVLQVSVFDTASNNKVAEGGSTLGMDLIERSARAMKQ